MNINIALTADHFERRFDDDNRVLLNIGRSDRPVVGNRVTITTKDGSVYIAEVLDDDPFLNTTWFQTV
jgi:hypothetical protein